MPRHLTNRRSAGRVIALLIVVVLAAAACSDDGGGDSSADSAGSDSGDATTTTIPGTTTPIPETGEALVDLQIEVVEFGEEGYVEIANNGDDEASLDGIYSCQFPTYTDLGTVVDGGVIAAGETVKIPAAVWGGLDAESGEAALYQGDDFSSADAILSYVQWGDGGHERAAVAAEAGIWPSADAAATPDPAFNSIESGGDPADPENWS